MRRRLDIAVFVYEFPALSETFVLNQLVGLLQAGHTVTVFAERPRDEATHHHDVDRFDLRRRTVYLAMPASRPLRLLLALPLLLRELLRAPGRALSSLRVDRYGGEARSLRLLFWLARLGRRRRFDVVYCHFGTNGRLAAFLRDIGALQGPLVTVFHGVDVSAVPRGEPQHYAHLFRNGDLFLPISERWRQKLLQLGCPPGRTAVHRMGVDLDRFSARGPSTRLPGPIRVLGIGRLIEKKGFADALEAVAGAVGSGLDLRYEIVGDGPLRRSLADRADALGIAGRVRFHGWLEQARVRELMRDSDILLAPSVTDANGDQEGIPVTLMEAMASGLPVLGTWHSGIPELVEDGVSGLLVPERSPAALTEALLDLARRPELRNRLAEAARRRVALLHDIRQLNRELAERFYAISAGPPGLRASAVITSAMRAATLSQE